MPLPHPSPSPSPAVRHMPTRGFTLTELAVVLVIVALLIGGLLVPLASQDEIVGRQQTEKQLASIREALMGFAIVNGRLPCPAQATTATGISGAGGEATTGSGTSLTCACAATGSDVATSGSTACTTTSVTGVLPWASLGLPEVDYWGRRYTYRVSATFARGIPQSTGFGCTPEAVPDQAAFALCSAGDLTVLTAASGGTTLASTLPAVVVSHGKNGLAAYLTSGSSLAGASGDELENGNGDATFVGSGTIDDQVSWIATPILMNRMISAGRLP